MIIANEWKDYKIIDMADGQKLEKWGNTFKTRPTNNMDKQKLPRKMEKIRCYIF